MAIFLAVVMAGIALAFVAYPFFRQNEEWVGSFDDEGADAPGAIDGHRASMLRELREDLESGALSQEEFRDLEAKYRGRRTQVMPSGFPRREAVIEDDIETQVRAIRRKGPASRDAVDGEIPGTKQDRAGFCSRCGTRSEQGDRFCAACGAPLKSGEKQ